MATQEWLDAKGKQHPFWWCYLPLVLMVMPFVFLLLHLTNEKPGPNLKELCLDLCGAKTDVGKMFFWGIWLFCACVYFLIGYGLVAAGLEARHIMNFLNWILDTFGGAALGATAGLLGVWLMFRRLERYFIRANKALTQNYNTQREKSLNLDTDLRHTKAQLRATEFALAVICERYGDPYTYGNRDRVQLPHPSGSGVLHTYSQISIAAFSNRTPADYKVQIETGDTAVRVTTGILKSRLFEQQGPTQADELVAFGYSRAVADPNPSVIIGRSAPLAEQPTETPVPAPTEIIRTVEITPECIGCIYRLRDGTLARITGYFIGSPWPVHGHVERSSKDNPLRVGAPMAWRTNGTYDVNSFQEGHYWDIVALTADTELAQLPKLVPLKNERPPLELS